MSPTDRGMGGRRRRRRVLDRHLVEPPTAAPPALTPGADVLSEAGAADRFARLHGYELRFDHRADRWLMWARHRRMPDTDGAITRVALDFARAWQTDVVDLPIATRTKAD